MKFLLYAAISEVTFFLPFDLMQVQGYSPTAAGAALVPFVLIMFSLSHWAGSLVDRYGAKLPLVVGPGITAVGFALFAVPDIGGSYWTTFFPAVLVMGIGMVITVAPLTTAVMGAVEERHAGVASGINNAVDRAAGLLAIAALGMVILSVFTGSLESHLAQLDISPQLQQSLEVQQIKLAGIQLPTTLNIELRGVLKHTIDEAFVSGFRLVSLICAGLALTGALCAGLMIESPSSKRKGQIGSIAKDEHIQYRHRTTSDTP